MIEACNPVHVEIYRNLFTSVAEEMGSALRRTSFSPNIKERRDYSCAVFDGSGELVALGDHMPVHLGSMPLSVRSALSLLSLQAGDVVWLNDPFSGGTHLPDITLLSPVFETSDGCREPMAYVACRAHHSDVGGMTPGSMPSSRDVFQEGVRIPPSKLYRKGLLNRPLLELFLSNVRNSLEREGDLVAQIGALRVGEKRLVELAARNGREEVQSYMTALQDYADRIMGKFLSELPTGRFRGEDMLDDDGISSSSVRIAVEIEISPGEVRVDFSGSSAQVQGCVNAVFPVTYSAVFYVLRCLAPPDAPSSSGLMRSVRILAPVNSVVNASFPAATAGGNVETSQRIVDVLLKAFSEAIPERIPAASSGSMTNVSLGGLRVSDGQPFSYYETVAGGMGAGPNGDGDHAVHTHMTNSLNTPIEVLERIIPVRVREYRIRSGSGGSGLYRGGDGIVRSFEFLESCVVTLLSDRRRHGPYGLHWGTAGKKGLNSLQSRSKSRRLPGKFTMEVSRGDVLTIETPGGGGWGRRHRES